jgi:2-keto-4-pentenoate hydratase
MMADLQELARRMLADFDARTPGRFLEGPLDLSTAQAYALQAEIARLRERRGESVIGYKVGCTSSAIQAQVGVSEPIFGRLFDTGCYSNGAKLSAAQFATLAVEGEFAVRLARDLNGEGVSEERCRTAIAEMFPVIELHHYVLSEFCPVGPWMIASNGLHAGLVLPGRDTNWPGIVNGARRIAVRINGVLVGAAEDEASLARPVASLKWLVRRLRRFGLQLRRGQLILTGSSLPLYRVAPGTRMFVEAPPLGASCVEIGP